MISITYKQVRKIFLSSCMIFMWHADTHAMLPQQGQNFQQVLADIGTDVDALLTCCSTTFTALGGLSPLIMADFNNTMTAIAGVSSLITTDFNNTMTALAALSALETNNVNQTFTALAAISALITQDFNATMTAIAGVSRLVTTGFNNTFTAIAGVSSLITTDFNATMTALAALSPLIIADFNSTFTVLAALSACNPIPLSQTNVNGGQGILLTTTGASYCLSQNITGSIIISAADITVDLNMHSLLGTIDIISTATNATIKNGNIKPVAPGGSIDAAHAGIVIASTVDKALIENCYIICSNSTNSNANLGRDAIANAGSNTIIDSCFIQSGTGGSSTTGGNNCNGGNGITNTGVNVQIKNCTILAGAGGAGGLTGYVSNNGNNTVSTFNTVTNSFLTTFTVGSSPRGVAITPDGTKAYVANGGPDNTVSVVNTANNAILKTIPISVSSPLYIAISPNGLTAYVCNNAAGTVSVIDTVANVVIKTIGGFTFVQWAVFSPNGLIAYVSSAGTNTVSIFNAVTNSIIGTISQATGGFNGPRSMVMSPNGKFLYVSNLNSTTVSVINTATNTLATGLPANPIPGVQGNLAITPDGTKIYVNNSAGPSVKVINTATGTVTDFSSGFVGTSPAYVAITPNGSTAYVSSSIPTGRVIPMPIATNTPGTPITGFSSPIELAITPAGVGGNGIVQQGNNGIIIDNIITAGAGGPGGSGGNAIVQQGNNGTIMNNILTGGIGGLVTVAAGNGVMVTPATNLNTIESCLANNSGGNGFTMVTTGTVNLLNCIANGNTSSGFNLATSLGRGLVYACVASLNSGCGFTDSSTSLYQYAANVAKGNDSSPAIATGDSNYCWSDFGSTSTFTNPSGPGAKPFFQFTPNNTGAATPNLSMWNNITI